MPGARIRCTQDQLNDLVRAPSDQYARLRPFHHDVPEFGRAPPRRSVLAEGAAGRFASAAVAGRNRDAEKSNIEPGSRTLYRACSRFHSTDAAASARPAMTYPNLQPHQARSEPNPLSVS